MEELTREQKLNLCIKAKEMYERNKGKMGLCEVFQIVMNEGLPVVEFKCQHEVILLLPEFYAYKPADKEGGDFWWKVSSTKPRKKVLKELIELFSVEEVV